MKTLGKILALPLRGIAFIFGKLITAILIGGICLGLSLGAMSILLLIVAGLGYLILWGGLFGAAYVIGWTLNGTISWLDPELAEKNSNAATAVMEQAKIVGDDLTAMAKDHLK